MKLTLAFNLILISFFFASCENPNTWKQEYGELKKRFPSELVSHFPKEENVKEDFESQLFEPSQYSPLQFFVKQTESKSTIDSLTSKAIMINNSDSSFYIVNKYLRLDNVLAMPQQLERYEKQEYVEGAVPIPNFFQLEEFSEDTSHHLKDTFTIFLIDAKPLKCCSENLHKGEWHMPPLWEDGYSKGYAVNKGSQEVIYWFVVW